MDDGAHAIISRAKHRELRKASKGRKIGGRKSYGGKSERVWWDCLVWYVVLN